MLSLRPRLGRRHSHRFVWELLHFRPDSLGQFPDSQSYTGTKRRWSLRCFHQQTSLGRYGFRPCRDPDRDRSAEHTGFDHRYSGCSSNHDHEFVRYFLIYQCTERSNVDLHDQIETLPLHSPNSADRRRSNAWTRLRSLAVSTYFCLK